MQPPSLVFFLEQPTVFEVLKVTSYDNFSLISFQRCHFSLIFRASYNILNKGFSSQIFVFKRIHLNPNLPPPLTSKMVGSWVATLREFLTLEFLLPPEQFLMGKQWSNQSVSQIKSKLLQVKNLLSLRLLAFCNVTNFNIFFLKEDASPQQLKPQRRLNTYSYSTYSHTLLFSLNIMSFNLLSVCNKGDKLRDNQQLTLNFLAEFVC